MGPLHTRPAPAGEVPAAWGATHRLVRLPGAVDPRERVHLWASGPPRYWRTAHRCIGPRVHDGLGGHGCWNAETASSSARASVPLDGRLWCPGVDRDHVVAATVPPPRSTPSSYPSRGRPPCAAEAPSPRPDEWRELESDHVLLALGVTVARGRGAGGRDAVVHGPD